MGSKFWRFLVSDTFQVEVNPSRIEINEGDNVTLVCNVSGTGVSSMTWNTENMMSLHKTSTINNGTMALHIYNVSTSDHFLIPTCTASNDTDLIQVGVRIHILRKRFCSLLSPSFSPSSPAPSRSTFTPHSLSLTFTLSSRCNRCK